MALAVAGVVGAAAIGGIALFGSPVYQRLETLGLTRRHIENIHGLDLKLIPGTVACEDLHIEPYSGQLYTPCQGDIKARTSWFPPLEKFQVNGSTSQGVIVVVNPSTFTSTTLQYTNFAGPMQPHGIELYTDPNDSTSTVIFVVSHLANPDFYDVSPPTSKGKARERIEIFKHIHGETTIEHIRSIEHPLIRTANDIAATGPTSFYVTNDHHYIEGPLRAIEDICTVHVAPWSDTLHVLFDPSAKIPNAGVTASVALTGLHNNNGLGNGRPGYPEVNVIDAAGGLLHRAISYSNNHTLRVLEHIRLPITLDNPFYYEDKYATAQNNASGYVVSGLARAYTLAKDAGDINSIMPMAVYHVRSNHHSVDFFSDQNTWETRLIFQDDGKTVRSASGAVLIGIDPAENSGRKQAWLFVTGFDSLAMAATKIDL